MTGRVDRSMLRWLGLVETMHNVKMRKLIYESKMDKRCIQLILDLSRFRCKVTLEWAACGRFSVFSAADCFISPYFTHHPATFVPVPYFHLFLCLLFLYPIPLASITLLTSLPFTVFNMYPNHLHCTFSVVSVGTIYNFSRIFRFLFYPALSLCCHLG